MITHSYCSSCGNALGECECVPDDYHDLLSALSAQRVGVAAILVRKALVGLTEEEASKAIALAQASRS